MLFPCTAGRPVRSYWIMSLLPDTWNCGLRMRRECRVRFPRHRRQRKSLISDPGMHHGTCVTHLPWCMYGSLNRGGEKKFPAFPAHAQPIILRIWWEAHVCKTLSDVIDNQEILRKTYKALNVAHVQISPMYQWHLAQVMFSESNSTVNYQVCKHTHAYNELWLYTLCAVITANLFLQT